MFNFSIGTQVKKELEEFKNTKIRLASMDDTDTVRYLKPNTKGYFFNQSETLKIIDLYYASKFENGPIDKQGLRKIFLNIGKFRTDISAKQIKFNLGNFKFFPDDMADPWTAIFMNQEFKEWAKDSYFGDLIDESIDNWPKYGSLVLKRIGKKIVGVPLQLLRNEQTAKDLDCATYVIEEHPDMEFYEMQEMPNWNLEGLDMKYGDKTAVFERYGRVPLRWLKLQNTDMDEPIPGDEKTFVDAVAIVCFQKLQGAVKENTHVFFAKQITSRPYLEVHWSRAYGRWLGAGVMEDLIENQQAKNIIINLQRRSLQWSAKRVLQSANSELTAKNLVKDVVDGEILDVGANGEIKQVDLTNKSLSEFAQFLGEFEQNSDHKAFTYESMLLGVGGGSKNSFRLGALLTQAAQAYFLKKQERLARFFHKVFDQFQLPQFLSDMKKKDRLLTLFSGQPGFEVLMASAQVLAKSDAQRVSLLSGKPVDASLMAQAAAQFDPLKILTFELEAESYQDAKYKFDFDIANETGIQDKVASLQTLYQLMAAQGDPRAEKVLERITELSGETMTQFGPVPPPQPTQQQPANPAAPNTPVIQNANAQLKSTRSQIQANGQQPGQQ